MSAIREIQQAAAALYEQGAIAANRTAQRFKVQREIESAIMAFRPDFCEAAEGILDALTASLARRYDPMEYAPKDRELIEAVFSASDAFRKALDAADERVPQ